MFRARPRPAIVSRASATRGSVGSARVWDEGMRARHARGPAAAPPLEPAPAFAAHELSALIAGIVSVTLDTRLPDCEPVRRGLLARELEARLLALFQAPATPGAATEPTPETPTGESADEHALGAPESEAGRALASASSVARMRIPDALALEGVLEDRLRDLGGALAEHADLRRRLVELALESLDPGPEPEGAAASSAELRTLDVLQRRASKLERSLAESRSALAYVAGLEHVEEGLASIYRTVQGLAAADPGHARKRGALEGIFRANLALQKPPA